MREVQFETVSKARTASAVICGVLLSCLASFADMRGFTVFLFGAAMFAVGVIAVFAARKETEGERLAWEAYTESDWRFFEMLQQLTGEQLEQLRSLCKRPDQTADAVHWLEKTTGCRPDAAPGVHAFFVRSGWASAGEISEAWLGHSWDIGKKNSALP